MQGATLKSLAETLFLLSLALSPIYLWQSGLPQISHILALLAMLARMIFKPQFPWTREWTYGLLFVGYTVIVDGVIYFMYGDFRTLLEPLQFAFDFGVFVLVVTLSSESGPLFLKRVLYVQLSALFLQLILVITGDTRVMDSSRATGLFNDPNQMAYWALWSAIIVSAAGKALYGSWWPGYGAFLLATIIDFFAASRSAALGLFTLVLIYAFIFVRNILKAPSLAIQINRNHLYLYALSAISLFSATAGVLLYKPGTPTFLVERAHYLFERFNERQFDDTLAGRGYDRLWKFPEYLLLGAGQGAFERFSGKVEFLDEIHSTWAGVLFNYGLIGFFLLVTFLSHVFLRVGYPVSLLLLPPFIYGFATFGLRNWYFWVGLATIYASAAFSQPFSERNNLDSRTAGKYEKPTYRCRNGGSRG